MVRNNRFALFVLVGGLCVACELSPPRSEEPSAGIRIQQEGVPEYAAPQANANTSSTAHTEQIAKLTAQADEAGDRADVLMRENGGLREEAAALRKENAELKAGIAELNRKIRAATRVVAEINATLKQRRQSTQAQKETQVSTPVSVVSTADDARMRQLDAELRLMLGDIVDIEIGLDDVEQRVERAEKRLCK
jgi:flagellar motility protein MotE (MotC chaperone)